MEWTGAKEVSVLPCALSSISISIIFPLKFFAADWRIDLYGSLTDHSLRRSGGSFFAAD